VLKIFLIYLKSNTYDLELSNENIRVKFVVTNMLKLI